MEPQINYYCGKIAVVIADLATPEYIRSPLSEIDVLQVLDLSKMQLYLRKEITINLDDKDINWRRLGVDKAGFTSGVTNCRVNELISDTPDVIEFLTENYGINDPHFIHDNRRYANEIMSTIANLLPLGHIVDSRLFRYGDVVLTW